MESARRPGSLALKLTGIFVFFMFIGPTLAAEPTNNYDDLDAGGEAVIFLEPGVDELEVKKWIEDRGGRILVRNPTAIWAELPPDTGFQLQAYPDVASVHTTRIDPSSFSHLGHDAEIQAGAWNKHLKDPGMNHKDGEFGDGVHYHGGMAHVLDDTLIHTDNCEVTTDLSREQWLPPAPPARPLSPGPGWMDTSEFMIGSIGVSIVFPESNGSIDTNTEDWTSAEETNVINEITGGMNWWTARNADADLSWSYTTYYKQPTSYEPISRNSYSGSSTSNMWTWINEILGDLGFNTGMTGARQFANYTRDSLGTDWGYIVWVADSSADGNGQFADNRFGFAALGGPYVVMTYDNNGYGIGGMDAVFAHETCHIFYALDEYSGSGADSDDRSGYENVLNGNALDAGTPGPITNVGCIMRGGTSPYTNNQVCGFTKGQIGWNDTDTDGIPNVVDTFPNTTLDSKNPNAIKTNSVTYWGNTSVKPKSNLNPWGPGNDVTTNRIATVQWRVDSGSWNTATAVDGTFDNYTEAFKFTANGLSEGWHTFEARATNTVTNVETTPASDSLLVDFGVPASSLDPLPRFINSLNFDISWNADDGSGSGIKHIELWYRKDGEQWKKYMNNHQSSPVNFIHEGDGYYEFYSIAVDNASNVELAPGNPDTFTTVESTPPVSMVSGLPGFTREYNFDVPYTVDDGNGVGVNHVELWYRHNGSIWQDYGDFNSSPIDFTVTEDGKYEFFTLGVDNLDNVEQKASLPEDSIMVDTVAPHTEAMTVGTEGSNGWYITGVRITLVVDDFSANIDGTYYKIGNSSDWIAYSESFTIPDEGIHDLQFYSEDKAGNKENTQELDVKIDTTEPVGTVLINDGAAGSDNETVKLTFSAQDGASGVTHIMYGLDAGLTGATWINYTDEVTYTLPAVSGLRTVYARFLDEAGWESLLVSDSIMLDFQPPIIEIEDPKEGKSFAVYQFYVTGTAKDNVNVSLVRLTIDGGKTWVDANGTNTWSAIVTVPGDGQYMARARAYDLSNMFAEDSVNFTVDASPPTVDLDGPKDNTVTEEKEISVKGKTDPGSVVKVNGAPVPLDDEGNFNYTVSLKEGLNTITLRVEKPSGAIEKKIRVIYTHPAIVISDLRNIPEEPEVNETVTIKVKVPGKHIDTVTVKCKEVGRPQITMEMTRIEGTDEWEAEVGHFEWPGHTIEYWVLVEDIDGYSAREPETGSKKFTIAGEFPTEPEPTEDTGDNTMYALMFFAILILFVVLFMALSLRSPKMPRERISKHTRIEHIDNEKVLEDRNYPGRRSERPPRRPPRGREPSVLDSDTSRRSGNGFSRFKDDEF
jgi:hypothetical protein